MDIIWSDIALAAGRVLLVGALFGAGLPALFALGLRLHAAGSGDLDGAERRSALTVVAYLLFAIVVGIAEPGLQGLEIAGAGGGVEPARRQRLLAHRLVPDREGGEGNAVAGQLERRLLIGQLFGRRVEARGGTRSEARARHHLIQSTGAPRSTGAPHRAGDRVRAA